MATNENDLIVHKAKQYLPDNLKQVTLTPAQVQLIINDTFASISKHIFSMVSIPNENIDIPQLIKLTEDQKKIIYDLFYPVRSYINFHTLEAMDYDKFMSVHSDILINLLKQK